MDYRPQYKTPSTFRVYQKRAAAEVEQQQQPDFKRTKYAGGQIVIPDYKYDKKEIGDKFQPFKELPTAALFP